MNNENLIECVQAQPHLWNKKDPLYKNVNFKEHTWETIAIELSSTSKYLKQLLRNNFIAYHHV